MKLGIAWAVITFTGLSACGSGDAPAADGGRTADVAAVPDAMPTDAVATDVPGDAVATDAPGDAVPTDAPGDAAPLATVWLCRPGLASNPCDNPLDTTVIQADGTSTVEHAPPVTDPPIDCFYVYPTVSAQRGINADLTIDPEETGVAVAQASRFSQVCRVFAPMYRQVTVAGLFNPALDDAARGLAYGDVLAAWTDYLAHDNHGRGVVLIGHSQGAFMLTRLVREQIDNDPAARARLVSALLLGGNIHVPMGRDVGGDFAHVPACRTPAQTGCVLGYSSFDHTPPATALFGRDLVGAGQILCANPAALGGGAAVLHPYFPTHVAGVVGGLGGTAPTAATPWVSYPMLFRGTCTVEGNGSWLQIDDLRAAGDNRQRLTDTLGPYWGLHLVDVNIALGDLVDLVRRQSAARTM